MTLLEGRGPESWAEPHPVMDVAFGVLGLFLGSAGAAMLADAAGPEVAVLAFVALTYPIAWAVPRVLESGDRLAHGTYLMTGPVVGALTLAIVLVAGTTLPVAALAAVLAGGIAQLLAARAWSTVAADRALVAEQAAWHRAHPESSPGLWVEPGQADGADANEERWTKRAA